MNYLRAFLISTAILSAAPSIASAVCFYPGTEQSGYRVPLADEASRSQFVVVGQVLRVDRATGSDAESGILQYEVKTLRAIRGSAPKTFTFNSADDSGGYRMELGETHLLFVISPGSKLYSVDACGNSQKFPAAQKTVDALLSPQ